MSISSVQYLHELQIVGLANDQAQVHAKQLEFIADEMKKEIRSEISNCIKEHDLARRIDIKESEIRLIKWGLGMSLAILSTTTGVIFEFFKLFLGSHS